MVEWQTRQTQNLVPKKRVGSSPTFGIVFILNERELKMSEKFAKVVWVAEDIKTLRPKWTNQKCEDWLESNERHIQNRLVEFGWGVIEDLLGSDQGEKCEWCGEVEEELNLLDDDLLCCNKCKIEIELEESE